LFRYADIRTVVEERGIVTLETKAGARARVRFGPGIGRRQRTELAATVAAFKARIEARIHAVARAAPHEAEARLRRGARTTHEWLRDLVAAREEGAGYRRPALPQTALWAIVEDAVANPGARAGATAALHASLDDEGRARILAAADACASTELRDTLSAL